jgi:hypothetical protein
MLHRDLVEWEWGLGLISAKAILILHTTGREGNRLDLREGQQQQLDLPAWRRESMYDVIYIYNISYAILHSGRVKL